ncbi:MAG TPA: hypothetical protein VI306_20770 [Pyrinomonadaceae bacterium]
MITGFNTDIQHDGVTYHVQTEDKGVDTPIILSLVYVGGEILASKRAPYKDLIAAGFSDEVLSERLKRQHRLICAAINSGRIEDLKKMGRHDPAGNTAPLRPIEGLRESEKVQELVPIVKAEPEPVIEAVVESSEFEIDPVPVPAASWTAPPKVEPPTPVVESTEFEIDLVPTASWTPPPKVESPPPVVESAEFEIDLVPMASWTPPPKVEPPPSPVQPQIIVPVVIEQPHNEAYTVHDSRGVLNSAADDGLTIFIMDEDEFYSGELLTMRILVVNRRHGDEKPLSGVTVSIKVLGTAFRPQIYSIKTDRDGVAVVAAQIPKFTSGRAAVLVRVAVRDQSAELRRVIHPNR